MSQPEWIMQVRPDGTLRCYILKGKRITARLKRKWYGGWVLNCHALGVQKVFLDEPGESIDDLQQKAKAYLCVRAEMRLSDLRAFVADLGE